MASCGQALCYTDNQVEKYIQISSKFIHSNKKNYFIIQADGTSLNLARPVINDKDFVLVRKMNQFENNNIVVAIINGLATIKIFKRNKDGYILLMPKSTDSDHKPIILHSEDDVTICGKVEKVFKLENNN
jgi:repressor LexA